MAIPWFYLFMGGFVLGVLFMNVESAILLTEDGIFAATEINRLKYLEIEGGEFFSYVIKKRIQWILIPAVLSTTSVGWLFVYGCFIWHGVLAGMMITAAIIRFGVRGLLLILAGIFPHQFFLFPAMVMLLIWCYENYVSRGLHIKNSRKQYVRQAASFLWICFMVFVGCILESYVNPLLVSDILKIF